MKFMHKFVNILNELKDTTAGYSSKTTCKNTCFVRHNGVSYKVTFEELEPIEITDSMRKRYNCDDESIEGFEQIRRIENE